jgi:hypothetical protein
MGFLSPRALLALAHDAYSSGASHLRPARFAGAGFFVRWRESKGGSSGQNLTLGTRSEGLLATLSSHAGFESMAPMLQMQAEELGTSA